MALNTTWTKQSGEIATNAYVKITEVNVLSAAQPYQLAINFAVWYDEASRTSEKPVIAEDGVSVIFDASTSLSYTVLYGLLKTEHPQLATATDVV